MGTLTIRPSESETLSASSVICTPAAVGLLTNVEVFILEFHEPNFMLFRDSFHPPQFCTTESAIPIQTHGRKPKLRFGVISLDVRVRRLIPVASEEKEAMGANSQAGRHSTILQLLRWTRRFSTELGINLQYLGVPSCVSWPLSIPKTRVQDKFVKNFDYASFLIEL